MWFFNSPAITPVSPAPEVEKVVETEMVDTTEVVVEKEVVESKAGEKTINDLEKEIEKLKEKLKNHKSVLFEGTLKNGRKISIQYWDEDDIFRVISKKGNDLIFRTPDISQLITYKKTNIN